MNQQNQKNIIISELKKLFENKTILILLFNKKNLSVTHNCYLILYLLNKIKLGFINR